MNHNTHHYIVMFVIMIISGLLSTMNVWIDKLGDFRISINDIYMIFLMTGWMFLFMGLYYREFHILILGLILVVICIFCIRTQFMVTSNQYVTGMIPYHSMAVLMSKRLLEKHSNEPTLIEFAQNIIKTQEKEIKYLKNIEK